MVTKQNCVYGKDNPDDRIRHSLSDHPKNGQHHRRDDDLKNHRPRWCQKNPCSDRISLNFHPVTVYKKFRESKVGMVEQIDDDVYHTGR